jgi:hypothetical protein
MDSDIIRKKEEQRDHYAEQLRRLKIANESVQPMQSLLDQLILEINALKNRPTESDEIPLDEIAERTNQQQEGYIRAFPTFPVMDQGFTSSFFVGSSSGSAVVSWVGRVGDLGTLAAQDYSKKFVNEFREFQESQNRPSEVRDMLTKLDDANLVSRFDAALKSMGLSKAGVGSRTSAATDMRTLIDGLKGVLLQNAQLQPKENMTWPEMARRLTRGAPGGDEERELIRQEEIRARLYSRLSDVLKDRESGSITDVSLIWLEVLNHIYAVLRSTR